MGAFIADFGLNKEGLKLFRINGTKDEIEDAIKKLTALGYGLGDSYEFEKAHMQSSVLVRMVVPVPEPEKYSPDEEPENEIETAYERR